MSIRIVRSRELRRRKEAVQDRTKSFQPLYKSERRKQDRKSAKRHTIPERIPSFNRKLDEHTLTTSITAY